MPVSGGVSLSEDLRITNANDFIQFSQSVNTSTNYSGTTVFLENDIDFNGLSEQFNPILEFLGTLNGQGYRISNLIINSSEQSVGIFGYSYGMTLENVIIDDSCSVTSTHSSPREDGFLSTLGSCYAGYGQCLINNIVNMGSVTFSGNATNNLFIGGILESLTAGEYEGAIKNCVNYGTISFIGSCTPNTEIGGIVASTYGRLYNCTVSNCINYGSIIHSGTSEDLLLGGITAIGGNTLFINCVSAGKLIFSNFKYRHIGTIIGSDHSGEIEIGHCLWTSDVGYNYSCHYYVTEYNTSLVDMNTSTVAELNEYADENDDWNKWLLNPNNNTITFNINGRTVSYNSQLILLPSLAENTGNGFSGWFTDIGCTKPFELTQVSNAMTLFSGWKYTVAFDCGNGTEITGSAVYKQHYGLLPEPTRTGHSFVGWFTEPAGGEQISSDTEVVTSSDHKVYAHWIIIEYALTFDFGNGTTVVHNISFNETINYPENVKREGYMFNGWSRNDTTMPAEDITIAAQWVESAEYVEIVFSVKDMKESEIKNILKSFTDEEYLIEEIKTDKDTGETKVIVKFDDKEKAEDFVRTINSSGRTTESFIRRVSFYFNAHSDISSSILYSSIFFNLL